MKNPIAAEVGAEESPGMENKPPPYNSISESVRFSLWVSVLQIYWLLNISLDGWAGCRAVPQPPPLKKSGVWGFWAGQNLLSVHWPSLGATALRSCWWNSWGTPHPKCCSGALISAKGWVSRTPRQPCAQYFNVFTSSPECSQDFEKQSEKNPPNVIFFTLGLFSPKLSDSAGPLTPLTQFRSTLIAQKQFLQAAGGSRRRTPEKSLRFQGLRSPGQLLAMRSSTAVVNQPQDLSVPLFVSVNIISLLKEGKIIN